MYVCLFVRMCVHVCVCVYLGSRGEDTMTDLCSNCIHHWLNVINEYLESLSLQPMHSIKATPASIHRSSLDKTTDCRWSGCLIAEEPGHVTTGHHSHILHPINQSNYQSKSMFPMSVWSNWTDQSKRASQLDHQSVTGNATQSTEQSRNEYFRRCSQRYNYIDGLSHPNSINTCIHTCLRTCIYTCINTSIYTSIYTCIYTCIYLH